MERKDLQTPEKRLRYCTLLLIFFPILHVEMTCASFCKGKVRSFVLLYVAQKARKDRLIAVASTLQANRFHMH